MKDTKKKAKEWRLIAQLSTQQWQCSLQEQRQVTGASPSNRVGIFARHCLNSRLTIWKKPGS